MDEDFSNPNKSQTPTPQSPILKTQVYLKKCFVAFTESIARVDHLSLSGKLLYPIADRFMVQWEPLAKRYKRSRYVGFVI
jgi:hypothetical protein